MPNEQPPNSIPAQVRDDASRRGMSSLLFAALAIPYERGASTRAINVLLNHDIKTVEDLHQKIYAHATDENAAFHRVVVLKNMGVKSARLILERLPYRPYDRDQANI